MKIVLSFVFSLIIFSGIFVSNFENIVYAENPTITSFSPIKGKVGDEVVITGTNFADFEEVKFGSIVAIDSSWLNDSQIRAKIPTGAQSNKITVKTTSGSAVSSEIFVVDSSSSVVSIEGACGVAKRQTFESKPTTNLCASGDLTEVKQNHNNWEWACNGSNGGKNESCTAKVGKTIQTTTTTDTGDIVDASSKGGGLVPDCPAEGCGFNELMILINNVIRFLLFTIATPLAALVFVYAGVMLLTSGGSPEKMTTAKTIIKNLLIGYVIALAAWLIINTILTSLGYGGPTFLIK